MKNELYNLSVTFQLRLFSCDCYTFKIYSFNSAFVLQLRQPLLLIASLTCRGKVNEACDDVYYFMKDRYFKNEHVEAILRSKWYPARVLRVVEPTAEELEQYKQEPDEEVSSEDKLMMLDQYGPPPELFKYEVKEEFENDDSGSVHTVFNYQKLFVIPC